MLLLRRATLAGGQPGAGAVLVDNGQIAWIGPDGDAPTGDARAIDLDGRLLLPAFVDAHVHITETGLLLEGVNLGAVRSGQQILDAVASAARARPGQPILGHGWDDTLFTDPRLPSADDLSRATSGADVYLTRVDVHSALVSAPLAQRLGLAELDGWSGTGRIERDAHHAARHATRFGISAQHRHHLQTRALTAAAAAGIAEVHECAAPHIGPEQDLQELLELVAAEPFPRVIAFWGEAATDAGHARAIAERVLGERAHQLAGLAGDLMADGSFGSRTAAVEASYRDQPGHRGHLYLDAQAVAEHVQACTEAGLRAGFHVIGDRAMNAVAAGFEQAALKLGDERIARAGHRLEHVEGVSAAGIQTLQRLGITASVQPLFDREWGGHGRMYDHRLGIDRAETLNPFAGMHAAGVRLRFGSDSPVTPFGPWAAVRAAIWHHTPRHRLAAAPALAAHLGRSPKLRAGDVADLAAWDTTALDDALRTLTEDGTEPACALTLRDGTGLRLA